MTKKDKILAFSAVALLLTSGYPALAQDATDVKAKPAVKSTLKEKMAERMGKGDGSRHEEMQKRGEERFANADKNGDGFLTKDEMLAEQKERLDKMFSETDTDKDGKLSREELRAGKMKMMQKFREKMKDRKGDFGKFKGGQDGRPHDGPPPSDDE